MDESKEEFVERVALEIVNQVRLMHFREGSSASMRTRKLKEIIESNSKILPNMLLEKITLVIGAAFYGEQLIEFASKTDKNVTLIHAENGVGKPLF